MKIFFKKILIILLLALNSCSYFNRNTVAITIDSDPSGAQIYIDGVLYGNGAKEIDLVPSKDYQLELVKEGYQTSINQMRTKLSFRKGREREKIRCVSDLLTSFLILPFFALKSPYCRDFTQRVYNVELTTIPSGLLQLQQDKIINNQSSNFSSPNLASIEENNGYENNQSSSFENKKSVILNQQNQNQDGLMQENSGQGNQNNLFSQSFVAKPEMKEMSNEIYNAPNQNNQDQPKKDDNKDYYNWQ